ncbi:MAG: hypothetical protein DRN27_02480 [Thermoplasmata archaeon]|nr:MAG: hypothetical protein DRN27_02480 [Thermoplasmata archaeon]
MKRKNFGIVLFAVIVLLISSNVVNLKVSGTINQTTYIIEDESYIIIGNDFVELVLDKSEHGGIYSFIDKQTGIDFRPDKGSMATTFLFWLNTGSKLEGMLNWQAASTEYQLITESDYSTVAIVNSNINGYNVHTRTTITIHNEDKFVEMRLSIENNENFVIKNISFPVIWGLGQIGSDSSDDTLFYPSGDGILLHDPLSEIENLIVAGGNYPGTLSMQLLCHFDKDETGLYFAAYDTNGNPKKINYGPMEWGGINHLATSFEFYISESVGNDFTMDYDIIVGSFQGDWYEAASIYKEWAETTPFVSGGKINQTKDIPDWFDDTSIIQFVNRDNPATEIFSLMDIVDITKEYSTLSELDTTVLIIGWEQNGAWVGPYYYPPVEGEQAFQNAMGDLKQDGNHGFTYISGTVWRITRGDIGYADHELFNSIGLPWVALKIDQTPLFDMGYESLGWHSGRMCPMTDFWHEMIVYNALESVRLGCDVVQIDEFPIGAIFPCYNASHGHPVGYSNEISNAYRSMLEEIRVQGRMLNSDFIMSTEEPCEFYLPYLDTYVSRDCAPEGLLFMDIVNKYGDKIEFIPFFSFVYHEYITSFGEGIGLDEGYSANFYNQMARALGKMFVTGEIIKVGGTPTYTLDMDLFELFDRTATAATTYAKEYVIYGEPIAPPEIDVPIKKIDWYNAIQGEFGIPIHEPAVFNSAWRKDDGTKGFVFINWYTSNVDFNVKIQDDELSDGFYGLAMIKNGERTIINTKTTLPKTLSLSLDQNDIVIIEIIESIETNPPSITTLDGPANGDINVEHTYTISINDPDEDMVYLFIDWGDNSNTGWLGPYNSDEEISVSHIWTSQKDYIIKAQAKDEHDVVSEWVNLEVNMPRTFDPFNLILKFFLFFFPNLPNIFPH